ncbi:MAG: flagellar hook-associated protein FlgK [Pseudomonadota bacterium]
MSIFSVGLSGLNAAQNALNSTSNNISNAYTPGYNREVTVLGEGKGEGGVQVNDTQRQFNQYVATQLNAATSKSSALDAYRQQVDQVDSLLADRDAGLAPLMQDFFSAMEDLASAPSDPAARQGVLGAADTLSAQFRSFDGYLQDMQEGINGQIADEVTQVNNATEQLAGVNREIALARARSGEAPNSLLNQRDHMVHELSERLDVRLDIQDGQTYNVTLPNGQPLVTGTDQYRLTATESPSDPQRTVLGYRDGDGNEVTLDESLIDGGTLGGLMQFRSETLDKTQNQVGQLAVSLAAGVNAQHGEGVDLNGDPGEALFNLDAPKASFREGNSSSAEVAASFDASRLDELRPTDYQVRFRDDGPEVTRRDNGEKVELQDGDWKEDSNELSFGGVTLAFSETPADGDRFDVQPVRRGARGIETRISDLDKIAAAGAEGGSGNNENALALQDLQERNQVGGSASFSGAYGAMVSDVGNRTNIVQVNLDAQQGLTEQLEAVQQSESGVNLDEEAANLIRYQQYYQANARVIETGSTVLDTILGLRN